MKLRASKLVFVLLLPCLLACRGHASPAGADATEDTPPPLGTSPVTIAPGNTPPDAAAPAVATPKPAKKPKPPRDPNAPIRPPRMKQLKAPKPIEFPLPIGDDSTHIVIPENSSTGVLLMNLMSVRAKRVSNELVQLNETHVDVNHPDGSEDFHIDLPASVFNLQTHIIASENPVTVRTQDFELTGDKMEFNTVDRTGKLIGNVHMHIHNLKQVAGPQPPPPSPTR